jgi:hypothetical protein
MCRHALQNSDPYPYHRRLYPIDDANNIRDPIRIILDKGFASYSKFLLTAKPYQVDCSPELIIVK